MIFYINTVPSSKDALQTIEEMVDTAIEADLTTIYITDNNSIGSLKEAILLFREKNKFNLLCLNIYLYIRIIRYIRL